METSKEQLSVIGCRRSGSESNIWGTWPDLDQIRRKAYHRGYPPRPASPDPPDPAYRPSDGARPVRQTTEFTAPVTRLARCFAPWRWVAVRCKARWPYNKP